MANSKLIYRAIKILQSSLVIQKKFKNYYSWKISYLSYSTQFTNSVDTFEIFTDLIREKLVQGEVPEWSVKVPDSKQTTISNVDRILGDLNRMNPHISCKMLVNELTTGIKKNNSSDIDKIVQFCTKKHISLPIIIVMTILEKYSKRGFLEGIISLQKLYKTTNETEYYKSGEFLHYFAMCYWSRGNFTKFLQTLQESDKKYPSLIDTTKRLLRFVIPQIINSRSEAQLINIIVFVKEFTNQTNDFYSMMILWNDLFLSDWFTDQERAQELLDAYEGLQNSIALQSFYFIKYLLARNKLPDIYRFAQVLLRYKFMNEYSILLQILFDYYCRKDDKNNCSEIVKSSVELNTPLRKGQYEQFISWSIYGSPFKIIEKSKIEKIYSEF